MTPSTPRPSSVSATIAVTGFADITGNKTINVNVRGNLEAALLQLFMHDLRAEGHINIAAGFTGTLAAPVINRPPKAKQSSLSCAITSP